LTERSDGAAYGVGDDAATTAAPVDELRQARAAKLGQGERRRLRQVERGDDLRHDAQVRRKRPGIGHRAQHDVGRLVDHRIESVRPDDLDQVGFGHIEFDRPVAARQRPPEMSSSAGARQHAARIFQHG
jgi:hypothetical protein